MRSFALALLFILSLAGWQAPAAQAQAELKRADNFYQNQDFALAIEAYKKVLLKKQPTLEIAQKLAHAYRLTNDAKQAEYWFGQVLTFPDHAETNLLFYADAAKTNGKYAMAKDLYLEYAAKVSNDAPLGQALAASCDMALQWKAVAPIVEVTKDSLLSSPASDFSPIFFENGLLFASDRPGPQPVEKGKKHQEAPAVYGWTGRGYLQLYHAKKTGEATWEAPKALGPTVNTQYHNATPAFSAMDNTLYFTRTNMVLERQKDLNTDPTSWVKKVGRRDYINRLEIYTTERKGTEWSTPKPFAHNKVQAYSVGHPALSPDGQFLYFVSDMPGGFGETDIYYCVRQADGSWGQPMNAGKDLNTAGRESFPTFGATGKFYFASDGHPGMGGLDLFEAQGGLDSWTQVHNLKYPLNSSRDDFGIVYDSTGLSGYFASNRDNDQGTDNIYSFKPMPVVCSLVGRTVEKIKDKQKTADSPVPNVLLQLYRENDGTPVEAFSDAKGTFSFTFYEGVTYTLKASKEGYLTKSVTITPECESVVDLVRMTMDLKRNELNRSYIVENIYYDLDKHEIRNDAKPGLDNLVTLLSDNPLIRIELSSHTDSRQSDHYNNMLSQLRAESAVRYIVSRGIDINRITAKGYGESKLLNRCKDGVPCSDEEHQLNRRTEFKLLDTGTGKVLSRMN